MNLFEATPASDRTYGLAEGPVWDADRLRVLWVDVNAGTVYVGRFSDGAINQEHHIAVDTTVGAVVTSASGDLLVAGARHLHTISSDGAHHRGLEVVARTKESRLNDGGCDPEGRFLVGSLALDQRQGDESLVRIEPDGAVTVIDDDLTLSNGLAFSPDDTVLYNIDTTPGTVWRRSYGLGSGVVGPRAAFVHIDHGSPDGMCIDNDGNLWIAIWGAGEVRCFAPSGEQLATVVVAAPNTSSVAFIGPNLDTLLITTASEQLSPADSTRYPDSGRLFTADVGVAGTPVHRWAGQLGTQPRSVISSA